MRKNSPRKWLHAVLDLLPVIIIPIFAIYSHRHTIDSYEVTRDKYQVVDFNQLIKNGNFINDNDWYGYNGTIRVSDNVITYTVTESYGYFSNAIRQYNNFNLPNHKILLHAYLTASEDLKCGLGFGSQATYSDLLANNESLVNGIITFVNPYPIEIGIERPLPSVNATLQCRDFYAVDLTQMFGEGNEPSVSEFNEIYGEDYYDYTLSRKELALNGTETLNNTDIGSQFVYALYTPIHDYFNLSQVGVFGELYNWLQLNMFNGTAPISIFIVYHVILYEFIMDLIFLVYCVFMFVIDFTERLIDCLFDKSFGGGR